MNKVWLISVNMGYGHQRTAYPLRVVARNSTIINANDYAGIPESDRLFWRKPRRFTRRFRVLKKVPLIGAGAFALYDKFQRITNIYPKRDMSRSNPVIREIYALMRNGWGKDLIDRLRKQPLPLLTTFYVPAFMAEYFDYPEEIYTVICDTDIARVWAPLDPISSHIKYLAPNARVCERLKLYGVKKRNIFLTGYPLPLENITANNGIKAWKADIAAYDLGNRLVNLDTGKR